MMRKSKPTWRWMSTALVVIFLNAIIAPVAAGSAPQTSSAEPRPDIVRIDSQWPDARSEMPAVAFFHDRHTDALGGESCQKCHRSGDDGLVFKYQRLEDMDYTATKELYHNECVTCHQQRLDSGQKSGPLTADCRNCHRQDAWPPENRQPPVFDHSLHYRHLSAKTIKPVAAADENNCSACHHVYDKDLQKTVYAKGEEGSCRYCHAQTPTVVKGQTVSAYPGAAHDACVACHQNLTAKKQKAGPVRCAGCHDPKEQAEIEKVAEVPRLKRGQPDAVLLMPLGEQATQPGGLTPASYQPQQPRPVVAFNHRTHEGPVGSCMACHHASLERCSSCHTATGAEKGNYVPLEQAMHQNDVQQSCIGCHGEAARDTSCAGCHAQIPARRMENTDCAACHVAPDVAVEAMPDSKEAREALARQMINRRSQLTINLTQGKIPEKVTIDAIADQYLPAVLPHAKIIGTLTEKIKTDPMARYFHRRPNLLCTSCHHNSPVSQNPPKCAACHSKPFRTGQPDRPGLMGAYHGQCIGCHQQMGIAKPAANDCKACHGERPTQAMLNTQG